MNELRQFIERHAVRYGLVREEGQLNRGDETGFEFRHARLHERQVHDDLHALAKLIQEEHGITARVEQQEVSAGKVERRKRMWSRIWVRA